MIRTAVRAGLVGTAVAGLAWFATGTALGAPPVPEPPVPATPTVTAPKTVNVEMGSEALFRGGAGADDVHAASIGIAGAGR